MSTTINLPKGISITVYAAGQKDDERIVGLQVDGFGPGAMVRCGMTIENAEQVIAALQDHVKTEPDVEWDRDPAASGWRSRAFLPDFWQVLVYDDGAWHIRYRNEQIVSGKENDDESGKKRALAVYRAITK